MSNPSPPSPGSTGPAYSNPSTPLIPPSTLLVLPPATDSSRSGSSTPRPAQPTSVPLVAWKPDKKPTIDRPPADDPNRLPPTELGTRDYSLFFPPEFRDARDAINRTITAQMQKNWLASDSKWRNGLGLGSGIWTGEKILGAGTYGICGLWRRDSSQGMGMGEGGRRKIDAIVVKQSGGEHNEKQLRHLRKEAEFLRAFADRGILHIVRMYGSGVFEELGLGTVPIFDTKENKVGRMLLEYCEGGDFDVQLREFNKKFSPAKPVPEEIVWLVFECLAKALCAIQYGDENYQEGEGMSDWGKNICHYDIKTDNVFVGNNNAQHLKTPILKIADFGLAEDEPKAKQDEYYLRDNRNRGTPRCQAPEQYDEELPDRKYGTHTNVWQVGKIMYIMINRGRSFNKGADTFYFEKAPDQPAETIGTHILDAPYSASLRRLVLWCLSLEWQKRPSAARLLKEIAFGKAACATALADVGFGLSFTAGITAYPEPGEIEDEYDERVRLAGQTQGEPTTDKQTQNKNKRSRDDEEAAETDVEKSPSARKKRTPKAWK